MENSKNMRINVGFKGGEEVQCMEDQIIVEIMWLMNGFYQRMNSLQN